MCQKTLELFGKVQIDFFTCFKTKMLICLEKKHLVGIIDFADPLRCDTDLLTDRPKALQTRERTCLYQGGDHTAQVQIKTRSRKIRAKAPHFLSQMHKFMTIELLHTDAIRTALYCLFSAETALLSIGK